VHGTTYTSTVSGDSDVRNWWVGTTLEENASSTNIQLSVAEKQWFYAGNSQKERTMSGSILSQG
jgi:hypothetical protein